MLFFQPLPRAVNLQTGAVDEDVDWPILRNAIAIPLAWRAQLARATAHGRMIGNGEIKAHRLQDRSQQTFGTLDPLKARLVGAPRCHRD